MYRRQRRIFTEKSEQSGPTQPIRKYQRVNLSERIGTEPVTHSEQQLPFRIKVCIRVRPFTSRENQESPSVTIENSSTVKIDSVSKQKSLTFTFDRVFDPSQSTRSIQRELSRDLTGGLLEGYNSSIFAYGATGSGKTYTMFGGEAQPGIAQLCLEDIFDQIEPQIDLSDFLIKMTCVELYNENLFDLMSDTLGQVELRESPTRGVFLSGATEIIVSNLKDAVRLLKRVANRRTTQATSSNETSSRSHAIIQLYVEQKEKCQGLQQELSFSKLSMIDLAGSEKSGTSLNSYESKKINQSLLVLGNCIHELARNSERGLHTHIPFRDSKLTRLLKDSLGGNTRTVMISTISPSLSCFDESYNTLVYSSYTNKIEVKLRRNSRRVDKTHIADYAKIIAELKCENERIKQQLGVDIDSKKYEGLKAELERGFQKEVQVRQRLLDVEGRLEAMEFEFFKTMYRESKFGAMFNKKIEKKELRRDPDNYRSTNSTPHHHALPNNSQQLSSLKHLQSCLTEEYNQIRSRRSQILQHLQGTEDEISEYVSKKVLQFELKQLNSEKANESKKVTELEAQRVEVNLLIEQLQQRQKIISQHNKVLGREARELISVRDTAARRLRVDDDDEEGLDVVPHKEHKENGDQQWFYSFLENLETYQEPITIREPVKLLPSIARLKSQDGSLHRQNRREEVPLPPFKQHILKKKIAESRRVRSKSIKLKSAAKDISQEEGSTRNEYSEFLERNINRYQSYKSKKH